MTTPMQAAVNEYASMGFSVIPIKPNDKRPWISEWKPYQECRPTSQELRQWFRADDKNLAIVCGPVSGNLGVLDIDDPELAKAMAADVGLQAETTIIETPRGGIHIYIRETGATSHSGPLVAGVADYKGVGGYVLAPPSSVNGRFYKMLANSTIMEVENGRAWGVETLALFDVVVAERPEHEPLDTANLISNIEPGNRNDSCFLLACKLRSDGYEMEAIAALVAPLARESGLEDAEIESLLTSVARYPAGVDSASHDKSLHGDEWPEDASEAAFNGVAGEIARTLEPQTEADVHAILANTLTTFSVEIGVEPHFMVGGDRHSLRLFTALVGATGKGRKGLSQGETMAIFSAADDTTSSRVTSGLSTGEGLIHGVRDPVTKQEAIKEKGHVVGYQDVVVDEGVTDKRLLVHESEFARTLRAMGRDGNTLSAILRQAWDSGNLRTLTRNSPEVATNAHLGLLVHITKDELLRTLDRTDTANGFANRFLWVAVQRSKLLPDGGQLPIGEVQRLAGHLRESLEFAKTVHEMKRDPEARDLWHDVYGELSRGQPGLFGAVTGRAEAQVMRLACLYGLMDFKDAVMVHHLEAALAFWKRCEQTARYVFGDATGDPTADAILRALRAQGRLSQTDIYNLFGRNKPSAQIEKALAVLEDVRMIMSETISSDRGRPTTYWTAR